MSSVLMAGRSLDPAFVIMTALRRFANSISISAGCFFFLCRKAGASFSVSLPFTSRFFNHGSNKANAEI